MTSYRDMMLFKFKPMLHMSLTPRTGEDPQALPGPGIPHSAGAIMAC
jgi:hypothetical protein